MYTNVLSIGHRCTSQIAINGLKNLGETTPFSWVNCFSSKNILTVLQSDFENFLINKLPPKNADFFQRSKNLHKTEQISFGHYNMSDANTIKSFERKIERFKCYLNVEKGNILFVYINEDYLYNEDYRIYDDENYENLKKINDYLSEKYPKLHFTIFNIVFKERENYKNIENIIYKIDKFNLVDKNPVLRVKIESIFRHDCKIILKKYINDKIGSF